MKSIFFMLFLGLVYANADLPKSVGTDFLMDNVVNPLLTNLSTNAINYLISSLFNLIGKRDLSVSQILLQVTELFSQYKDKVEQIVQNYLQSIQQLFNLFDLTSPAKSQLRITYIHLAADAEKELKKVSSALISSLSQIFQAIFGQNFLQVNEQSKSVFNNISTIINNFTQTVTNILDNLGESLIQSATSIAQMSVPLINNLTQDIILNANTAVQQLQDAVTQLAQNILG